MKIGLLGYGYVASFFADCLIRQGYDVWGTTRNRKKLPYRVPFHTNIVDFNEQSIVEQLHDTSCLLVSTPPNAMGDPVLTLLNDIIISHKANFQWIGYLSSTGVYGDHKGKWVDETSLCYAKTEREKCRLSAEKSWLSLHLIEQLPIMIFRLSGIYGPNRNALERLSKGKKTIIVKEGHYFSRIHIADICQALYHSLLSPKPGEIINLSDDYPCSGHEIDCLAADLLQIERPKLLSYEQAELSSMAKEFYENNRRISNAKLKKTILQHLQYPTYKEGLQALLKSEKNI